MSWSIRLSSSLASVRILKNVFSFLLIAFISFTWFSCQPGNRVKVESFTPTGEVEQLTTFTVVFSKDLAPAEKQNLWLDDEFIKFEPAAPGKYKWLNARTLVFSPESPLEPMQNYKAKITNLVLFSTGYSAGFDDYEFHTPALKIISADVFWSNIPDQYYKLTVQAKIKANYAISPEEIKKNLVIERNGEKAGEMQVLTTQPAEVISVVIGEIQQVEKPQELVLRFKKGLVSVAGKEPLNDEKVFRSSLPPITQLTIQGVTAGYDGTNGWIEITASQAFEPKKVQQFVELSPKKPFTVTAMDNVTRIEAPMSDVQRVGLLIKKGMPGRYGGFLREDFSQTVSLTDIPPKVNFTDSRGKYLLRSGEKIVRLNTVNVNTLNIEVSQVFKNNLALFLASTYYYGDDSYYHYYYVGNLGQPFYHKKIQLEGKRNWLEEIKLPLDTLVKAKQKGIFVVEARSDEHYQSDSKIIALTDLGIITKWGKNQVRVYVNSISEAKPVRGVEISVISSNNQTLLKGRTDCDGCAIFDNVTEAVGTYTPIVITAEKDDDFNYIDLRESKVETSRYNVGGIDEYPSDYQAYVYAERNIYRPGETMNLVTIVRDDKFQPVHNQPCIVKILSPTGRVIEEMKKDLDNEGSGEIAYKISDYALTGSYTADVYMGGTQLSGSFRFSVEEFVPDKIRLNVKPAKKTAVPGETVPLYIDAEYLFGAKAAGLQYEVTFQFMQQEFRSKKFPDYDFSSLNSSPMQFDNIYAKGTLDDNGKATINWNLPISIPQMGYISSSALVSIFDLTGRPVNRGAYLEVYPRKEYLGIFTKESYFGLNQDINFKFAVVDPNDKPVQSTKIGVKLLRYEWQSTLRRNYSSAYSYSSAEKIYQVWSKEINVNNGLAELNFAVNKSGRYELQFSKSGDEVYQKKTFYAYEWTDNEITSFEVNKEGMVNIVADKKVYAPGEMAKLLFTAPFDGKMLVTVERNGVLKQTYVDVENHSAEYKLPIDSRFLPNIYVGATLFRKHNAESDLPMFVGHGFVSLKVEKKENKLPVNIKAPSKIKPNSKQEIIVSSAPQRDIHITLAAVDEGILQLTGFGTPDPYDTYYAKRQLKVQSYDLYKLLLPEIKRAISQTGGDEAMMAQLKKRINPITVKRFVPFTFFSGIKRTGSDGKVKIAVNVPQFTGNIRLMAIAYSGSRFGSGETNINVADDLLLEPQVPRVITAGDSIAVPVTLLNTTNSDIKTTVNCTLQGPLTLGTDKSISVVVPKQTSKQVKYAIRTTGKVGEASILFETAGGVKITDKTNIAVRPPSPYVTESGSGVLTAGKSTDIKIPAGFVKGTYQNTISISRFPALQFARQLRNLLGYPYGCVEQTVSRVFPLLYFEELAKVVAPEQFRGTSPSYFVKEGIRRLSAFQLPDGAMAYWQGGDYSSWWGSVYAAHFLVEARKAGYNVPDPMLQRLLDNLAQRMKANRTTSYTVYRDNKKVTNIIANKEIIYSLYVLAIAGKGDLSLMNYYRSRPQLLSNDMKYLLAGAYAYMSKWNSYYDVVPRSFVSESCERQYGGSFDSRLRSDAMMLNILLDLEPSNKQIPLLLKHLAQNTGDIVNTQEEAFIFLALGKAAVKSVKSNVKVQLIADGKQIGSYTGNDLTFSATDYAGKKVTLKAEGKGEIYYFWNAEGVKESGGIKEEDVIIKARRTYYDFKSGRKITDGSFYQGQLLVCGVSVSSTGAPVENIAVCDMIPSGFEIENPRLNNSRNISWLKNKSLVPQYLDIRDDRLSFFTSLNQNETKEYYYIIRVVNLGRFILPAVEATAMYNPAVHSYNGKSIVRVTNRAL